MQEEFLSVPWSAACYFEGDFHMHAESGWGGCQHDPEGGATESICQAVSRSQPRVNAVLHAIGAERRDTLRNMSPRAVQRHKWKQSRTGA
jgi:hypothetical protein